MLSRLDPQVLVSRVWWPAGKDGKWWMGSSGPLVFGDGALGACGKISFAGSRKSGMGLDADESRKLV